MNIDMIVSEKIVNKAINKGFKCKSYEIITIYDIMKWLRDEKEVDIVIEPIFFHDDNSDRIRNYNCVIFAPQLNKPKHCDYYNKWEESAIAGIEYTLKI